MKLGEVALIVGTLLLGLTGSADAGPAEAENAVAALAAEVVAQEKITPLGYYVVGSHAAGNIKPHSDIDVVAIVPSLDKAYRQTGLLGQQPNQQPYQIAVYGLDNMLKQFESERISGNNVVMRQIAHGKIYHDTNGALADVQQAAQRFFAAGPLPMTAQTNDAYCYRAKSWLADFSDDRPAAELHGLMYSLYPLLADYYLRTHGHWGGGAGKWLYRVLAEANPDFAARLDASTVTFIKTGDKQPFMAVAAEALEKSSCDVNNHKIIDPPLLTIAPPPPRL